MKKICLLILLVLLLSGCTVNYDLVYVDGVFQESLDIVDSKDSYVGGQSFTSLVNNYYNNVNLLVDYKIQPGDMSEEEIAQEYDTYKKSIINKNNIYGLNLKFDYNSSEEYINSSLRYSLFENMNITDEYFSASEIKNIFNNYANLEKIIVSFKTDKYVNYNNADSVVDGKYIWNFTKDNYKDKNIKITFSDENNRDFVEVLQNETKDLNENDYNNFFKNVFIGLGVTLFIISVFVFIKFKNSNKK